MCSSLMLATKNMKFVSIKLNFVNQNLPDTHTGVQYNCAHISRLLKWFSCELLIEVITQCLQKYVCSFLSSRIKATYA